jgi:hypothetical protein
MSYLFSVGRTILAVVLVSPLACAGGTVHTAPPQVDG